MTDALMEVGMQRIRKGTPFYCSLYLSLIKGKFLQETASPCNNILGIGNIGKGDRFGTRFGSYPV